MIKSKILFVLRQFKKLYHFLFVVRILKQKRQEVIIKKQIELIGKVDDTTYVKDFLDETPYKKVPMSKFRMGFYIAIILSLLTLFGVNVGPLLLLIKPLIGF